MKEIIKEEMKIMIDHFYNSYEPKISNLNLNLFTSERLFVNNQIQNIGTSDYEKRISSGVFVTPAFNTTNPTGI